MKYRFLVIWGIFLAVGSIEEIIHPMANVEFFVSPVFVDSMMLLIGVVFILSFFIINRAFKIGRRLAVTALGLNIAYFVTAVVYSLLFVSHPLAVSLWAVLIAALIIAVLSGYIYRLCNQIV